MKAQTESEGREKVNFFFFVSHVICWLLTSDIKVSGSQISGAIKFIPEASPSPNLGSQTPDIKVIDMQLSCIGPFWSGEYETSWISYSHKQISSTITVLFA